LPRVHHALSRKKKKRRLEKEVQEVKGPVIKEVFPCLTSSIFGKGASSIRDENDSKKRKERSWD